MARFSLDATIRAVDRFSRPIAKMTGDMSRFTKRTEKGFARLKRGAREFKAALGPIGAIARKAAMVGAAIAGAGALAAREIIKTGASFEEAITSVGAVGLQTREQIKPLEDMAKQLGATTKFTATEAAQAMEIMAKAGFKNEEILSGVPGVLSAAAASGLEMAEVANHVSNVLKGMGLETSEAGRVSDVLALASARTNSSIGSLGESMKNVASTARKFNIPLEDVVAGVALLQDVGLDASVAGSAMNTMLTKMAAPTAGMVKQMKELDISFEDAHGNMLPMSQVLEQLAAGTSKTGGNMKQVAFLAEMVGLRGQKAASNLADLFESGKVNALVKELKQSEGAAKKMADLKMDNLLGDWTLLGSAVDALKTSLFETQAGPLRDLVKGMTDWVSANQDLITSGIKQFMDDVLPAVKEISKAFGGAFLDTVKTSTKALGQFFDTPGSEEGDQWVKTLSDLATNLGKVAAVTLVVAGIFAGLTGGLILVVNTITSGVIGAFDGFVEFVGSRLFAVVDWFEDLAAKFRQKGKSFFQIAKDVGAHIIKGLVNGIKGLAKMPLDAITDIGSSIWGAMKKSLGLGSPSRIAAKNGAFLVQGLTDGMLKNLPAVEAASKRMADMALPDIAKVAQIDPIVIPIKFATDELPTVDVPVSFIPGAIATEEASGDEALTRHEPRVLSQADQVASAINESYSEHTDRSEVTIKDDTGRAEITKKPKRGGLRVQQSGAF